MENQIKKLIKTYDIVKELLSKHPELRDDDQRLVANYWNIEIRKIYSNLENVNCEMFLRAYSSKWLTNSDIITRARRKAEEKHPELRGLTWNKRHKISEKFEKEVVKI